MDFGEALKILAFSTLAVLFAAFVYICVYILYCVTVSLKSGLKQNMNKTEEPSDR